jgi:short-subunit dehydrogenase
VKLRGRVCVVTGASSGIGRATAIEMARAGATLALVSRDGDALARTRDQIGGASTAHTCDVADAEAVSKTVAEILEVHGAIDVLFANAGYGHFRPLVEMTNEQIERMVAVNVLGQMYFVREVLPSMMRRRSGHVIVMSSTNGRIPPPLMTVYNATRFASIGFAESLLYEVEPYGIGVTIVYPGAIDTPFFAEPEFGLMRTPKKIPPSRVARAIVRGAERGAYDVTIPASLRLPAIVRALAPPLVRRGVRRYAASVVPRPDSPR